MSVDDILWDQITRMEKLLESGQKNNKISTAIKRAEEAIASFNEKEMRHSLRELERMELQYAPSQSQ